MKHGRSRRKLRQRQLPALARYRDWPLHDAKAHLSDLVRRAREDGPQRITVYGEDAVIVVSAAEFAQMLVPATPKRSLHALLSDSPLRDLELGEAREPSPVRDVDL